MYSIPLPALLLPADCSQRGLWALKSPKIKVKKSLLRKGMVMVAPSLNPVACWEFEGEILVLHHPTTIQVCFQAMVHCGSVRQTATILEMSQDCLRTGDRATLRFRFIKNPEYLRPGQKIVFREGRTKAVGEVTKTVPMLHQVAISQETEVPKVSTT
ncbi:GTP-binding protein 1-like [Artemia franciscana]|uniref:GTP-binding protein 1-like n=1 Tax=Artemia franciscana TaxID=6661 RepID=UPI0032D9ECE5